MQWQKLLILKIILIVSMSVSLLLMCKTATQENATPLSARFDPEKQPFAFSIPNLKPVPIVNALKAKDCGICHEAIYDEWRQSTHTMALRDIQFQAEISKPDSPKWLCLNCHIPVQNQREFVVNQLIENDVMHPVKQPNPAFDAEFQAEGISCATCHIREDEHGESYIIGSIGSKLAPHPVKKDSTFLQNICLRCHNPQGEAITANLVCWFETVDEIEEAREQTGTTNSESQNCVDCHMPITKRRLVASMPELPDRTSHMHHWVGSGIPKWFSGYDHLSDRGFKSALEVEIKRIAQLTTGRTDSIIIALTNARAGHYLPTADPERFLLIHVKIEDKAGIEQFTRQLRIGQEWQWNPARKIGDNRLKHEETRKWKVEIPGQLIQKNAKLIVQALHVRLNTKNAIYLMEAQAINENWLPNGQELVANAIAHYPFASFIFREEIDLGTLNRRTFSQEELIHLSKLEKNKPLSKRIY